MFIYFLIFFPNDLTFKNLDELKYIDSLSNPSLRNLGLFFTLFHSSTSKSLEKIFLYFGYSKRDFFDFENKKLNAFWYSPPNDKYPRVFISELRIKELSSPSYKIIQKYLYNVNKDPVDDLDFNNLNDIVNFFQKPLWELPKYKDYKKLLNESEYAAWVIYNRYYLNHYTMSIHMLNK